jgi:hypothetical protein
LDQLPATLLGGDGAPFSVRDRIEETEHNVEDLLLCLQALRADDVPSISWNWNENAWHPDTLPDEHYPQYFLRETDAPGADYHAIWSAPLCRRDPNRPWHDGERYLQGRGRQVLLFDYRITVAADGAPGPARLAHDSIRVVLAAHEDAPVVEAFASLQGNKIAVDAPLLISLVRQIDALKDYLRLEKQVLAALERRANRHADLNLHSNE